MLDFYKYQSFPSAEAAQPFLELLRQHNVLLEAAVDTGEPVFNPAMTFGNTYSTYVVKLHGPDFEWVRRLEEDANRNLLDSLSPDHYLFSFTDVELFYMLANCCASAGAMYRPTPFGCFGNTAWPWRPSRNAAIKPALCGATGWLCWAARWPFLWAESCIPTRKR